MKTRIGIVLALVLCLSVGLFMTAQEAKDAVAKADKLYTEQNFKDAAEAYEAILADNPERAAAWYVSNRVLLCHLRMEKYQLAENAALAMIQRFKGNVYEARAEKVVGNLYLRLPHWGTIQGGKFLRSQYGQGRYVQTQKSDKKIAVEHLERARELYAQYAADKDALASLTDEEKKAFPAERMDCIFDLVSAVVRFTSHDMQWYSWGEEWGEEDQETVGEEEEHEMRRGGYGRPPVGMPVDGEGNPIFDPVPEQYSAKLPDGQKMKCLLHEIEKLDETETQEYRARAVYRRAMLARARYGPDRLNTWLNWWYEGGYPLKDQMKKFNLWELKDNEALTLVGSSLRIIQLPKDEDILALLRQVTRDYPLSTAASEAFYGVGLYYQSREQYTEAIAEYTKLIKDFEKSSWKGAAETQIATILAKEIVIEQTNVQLAGDKAHINVTYRNTNQIQFKAHELDIARFIADAKKEIEADKKDWWESKLQNLPHYLIYEYGYKNYISKQDAAVWDSAVKDDGSHRYATADIETPLTARGAYVIEASTPQANTCINILIVQDLVLIEKSLKNNRLFYVCDARTGWPVANANVDVFEYTHKWVDSHQRYHWYTRSTRKLTADNGIVEMEKKNLRDHQPTVFAMAVADGGRMAFAGVQWWGQYSPSVSESGCRVFVATDRPVYRPSHKVNMKLWVRERGQGDYVAPNPQAPSSVWIQIRDPKGNTVFEKNLSTDSFGGVCDSFVLDENAALGMYHMQVKVNGNWVQQGGGQFRVEEYKKPEYEVTVTAAKGQAKLGEKLEVEIKARYFFGAPVTDATVKYKVFRQDYDFNYFFPGEWDWLYGPGYGYCWYDYPWFPWWGRWACKCVIWYPWWGGAPQKEKELVKEGEARIGEDGIVKVTVDTTSAKENHPDRDHIYFIKAEVRDASRRTIEGEGSVKVTRQQFYVFMQTDRGFYDPKDQVFINLKALTPDNAPIKCKGKVTVSRVAYTGQNNAQIVEEPIQTWDAETDDDGKLDFSLAADKSGQFKVAFETQDSWGEKVIGAIVFWVAGGDFDGTLYRFSDLELITDKRSYAPGETAHVMLNAAEAGTMVLFSDQVDNGTLLSYTLIPLTHKTKVLDIPITKSHVPNFFIEATAVRNARLLQQVRELCVPPQEGMINVTLTTNKAEYKPNEEGEIEVKVTTPDGKPVQTQIALTAFDKSVLYIQPEITPDIRAFFWGQKRSHYLQILSSLQLAFTGDRHRNSPQHNVHGGPIPDSWFGTWGAMWIDWRGAGDEVLQEQLEGNALGFTGGSRRKGGEMADGAPAKPGAPEEAKSGLRAESKEKSLKDKESSPGAPEFKQAEVRTKFADTALWLADLNTDENGVAKTTIKFPENLTTWKMKAYGITTATRVGAAESESVTTKKLILRLQAPRFFVERDEVVLSANVHNYLAAEKTARCSIEVTDKLIEVLSEKTVDVVVPANGEKRVDWVVKVKEEGVAEITMKALTDEESDAMGMKFPVLVHGIDKTVSLCGSIRTDGADTIKIPLSVPAERKPSASWLEVRFSPSLAGAVIDAMPYLISYPYGCTEQTLSRFLPTVIVRKTLSDAGIKLEDIASHRTNLNAQQLGDPRARKNQQWKIYADSPVFDSREVQRMIDAGLDRLYSFQKSDGGWGWWAADESSMYMTAYALYGLMTALECDVKVRQDVIARGYNFLEAEVRADVEEMKKHKGAWCNQAYLAFVLSLQKKKNDEQLNLLYERRAHLNLYGKAMLALTFHKLGDAEKANLLKQNIMQYYEKDDENQTAWFKTPEDDWWYWWNNDIETNAYVMKMLVALEPKSEVLPKLVKWLLNNRRNGWYWRSTRDTAICVQAMCEYMRASGESVPDYNLVLSYDDGAIKKETKVSADNMFTFDNTFSMSGDALTSGDHTLAVTRQGKGAVYYSCYLNYFTKEEDIKGSGLEIKSVRTYYKLERVAHEEEVEGSRGQKVTEERVRYKRIPLKSGDTLISGDLLEVELRLISKNDYDYLVFEDMKPAGCEPVALRSGGRYGELCSNMELRDEMVVFFIGWLSQGEHLVSYRLRAEIPGKFHVLPTKGWAMYAPELRCISDEIRLNIEDKKE
ncbi:MAG: MG2 domain-containing protein [Planctomycetota bacterium]|nr:MG2 domain-containing protein [Planctomycetota bacterium]